jgi:AcrR family transcriptional regulator
MTRKEMILKAATVLFAEKGYKDTSMAEVAQITQVAQGTIFYHYKTKEELFISILKEFKDDLIREFEHHTRARAYRSGLHMAEDIVGFYLHLAAAMEERFLLLHRHDAYELARTNTECREHLEAIYNCLADMFESAVRRGQQDGSIHSGPARKTAMIILTMVDGLVRFNTYHLYDAGVLYEDLIDSCRKVLKN